MRTWANSLREWPAESRFSRRSSIHFTGRPSRYDASTDRALLAVHEHLLPEPAADVARGDPDVAVGDLEEPAEEVAGLVDRLRRAHDLELVATLVVRHDDPARLHGHRDVAVLLDVALHDVRRVREHLVEVGGERHERHGGHRVRFEAPARVHDVLGVGGRDHVVDHRLLRLVVDLDHLAGVFGQIAALGDHDGDRVTHVADVGDRERWRHDQLLAQHGVVAGTGDPVEVLPGVDGDDARHRLRRAGVDAGDGGPGEVAAEERGMERSRHLHVVDVEAVAGEEALVFLARDRLAEIARGNGRDGGLGHGRNLRDSHGCCSQTRSTMVPVPRPPPQHIVTSARCFPERSSSWMALVSRTVPVPPSGCPSAIAPPLGLTRVMSATDGTLPAEHNRRERLVDLDQVDVVDRELVALEQVLGGGDRAGRA